MSETSIEKLLELMRQLRDPDNGCEWDKKQTFESLLPYLDEEAKEVAEAIKNKDYINLKEELGDLLLQICLLYTSPSPRDRIASRMPSSA